MRTFCTFSYENTSNTGKTKKKKQATIQKLLRLANMICNFGLSHNSGMLLTRIPHTLITCQLQRMQSQQQSKIEKKLWKEKKKEGKET